MKGWKTLAAAGVSIVYGIAGMLLGLHDAKTMMEFVVAGCTAVGLGHKLDKLAL